MAAPRPADSTSNAIGEAAVAQKAKIAINNLYMDLRKFKVNGTSPMDPIGSAN